MGGGGLAAALPTAAMSDALAENLLLQWRT